jgi:large subunit ribosomal protein L25
MEQLTLAVETRDGVGKSVTRKLRKAGRLPGVLYGLGHHTTVTLDPRVVERYLLEEGGRNRLFVLDGANVAGRHALIKEFQIHPVSRRLVHVDLLEIDVTKKIEVTVSVNYVGKAVGVADGGVLNIVERSISVRCLPNQIPAHIDVDVTALAIGHSLHLEDLQLPEGIEKSAAQNLTLVTVVPPTKEEEAAPSLTPSAAPEVITEKKPAEGAAESKDKK